MIPGSRSEQPSSEPLIRANPRGGSSTSTLADPTRFISRSSSSAYSNVSDGERLVINRVALQFPQPGNHQQLHQDSQTKPSLQPSYEYSRSSQSLGSRSSVAGPETEDDLTLPLNLTRTTGHEFQEHHSRMNTGLYSHGSEMVISASHLDRQINSFIQETTVMSPHELAAPPRHMFDSSDRHERPSSNASSPHQATSGTDDEGDEDDGGEDFRSNVPHSNLRMAGSRPPSRAFSVRQRSRAASVCSSFMEGGEESQIPGYLFLHEVPPLRIKKSTVANNPPSHSHQQRGTSHSHSRSASHRRRDPQQHPGNQLGMQSHPRHHAKSGMGVVEQDSKAPIDIFKSPQHAWYFVRRLVGLELRWEAARAWKLTDLSLNSASPRKDPLLPPRVRSDDDQSAYSWDSSSGETSIAAESLPILSYLIHNFLLTLPIIRDTVSVVQNVPHSSHFNPQVPTNHTSVAVYWTAGVLPILRRLHQSNLSAAIDLGSPGFLHILFDFHVARLLERFVATSLKLCTHRLDSPPLHQNRNPASCAVGEPVPEGTRRPFRSLDQMRPFEVTSPDNDADAARSPEEEVTTTDPKQAGKMLAPIALLPDRATNSPDTHYFRDITPVTVSPANDFGAPERERAKAYVHNFEKEPQRYSGISVQPSQRASIGIVTPSNSNSNETHPLNRTDNFSAGLSTHETQRTGVTPINTPSSKTFSSSSTYDGHPTDTELSTFMPSAFGSIQESPLTPSWNPGFNQADGFIGQANSIDSFSQRKSVACSSKTSEEVTSVRQTIERMKMERQNASEHTREDDNKSNAPSRMSRKFSWIRSNGTKIEPGTDPEVSQKVSANFDLRRNSVVSEEARVPHTPMLNKSFHARTIKEANKGTDDHKESAKNNSSEVKAVTSGASRGSSNAPLSSGSESVEDFEKREGPSARSSSQRVVDKNHYTKLLREPEMKQTDADTESKRASKWGFTLKSLSLLKSNSSTRTPEDTKRALRKSWWIKSEVAPNTFLPPSPNALSLKFSGSVSPLATDKPVEKKVAVPESLVEGLTSPYKNIYQPEILQFQLELLEMPKDSVPWPWGDPVPFWKGTPVHKLSWGGFEVDLVGIRQGTTKNSYVIRVRRPSRLDEYVLRKESQFKNYCRRLSKDFPNAHVRAVPPPEISLEDDLFSLDGLMQENEQHLISTKTSGGFGEGAAPQKSHGRGRMAQPPSLTDRGPSLTGNPFFVDPFTALPLDPVPVPTQEGIKRRATLASIFGVGNHKSKFSLDTRSDWNGSNLMGKTAPDTTKNPDSKNERVAVDREIVGSASKPQHPGHSRRGSLRQIKVSSDTHRRALRGWLRDTLSIRTVGHHPETAAFLLLGSVVPEERDLLDVRQRELIDEERRKRRVQVAQGAAERSKTIHEWWSEVKSEFMDGEGLQNLSTALKQGSSVEELPLRFQKALEWIRMNVAEGLHELLVIGNQSDILFGKLLGLNAALPWSLIKSVLKIKKPALMCKALLDVFLAKKSNLGKSKHSVIQRLIEIAINETEGSFMEVERRIQACRARIQSLTMCEKIIKFVHASKDLKDLFRQYSESADIELVVAIVRSAEEPRLDKYDLERVMSASKAYKSLLAKNRNRITSSMTENIHVRLILDLKLYLRLISQEWDSKQIRKMLSEDSVAEAMEVLVAPLMELLKRTYTIGNAVQALDDAQNFIEQLITVVNALRSRIQDPQKSIRVLARLLTRHQNNFYGWLHQIHTHDSIVEEFFEWLSRAINFLKEGLLEPILVSEIIPSGELDQLSEELDEMVEWEEAKRKRQYEQLCRRYSADVDGDDPVIVEGDGFGRSKVEPLVDLKPLPPQLDHLANCLDLFRAAIRKSLIR
ncbi:hypothetical protein PGT21_003790 [Puccinia graminis f. sp. tritici]|uniref:PX domain-containing protein n=2 Tax=Puccinia graminis f. sp. tritici TaxID=56615 RepID=A0A5B0PFB9_PUCGR|nr:hypothetical protein PGT21_003790 [Puccinia graminis f. sp. tritici]